MKIDKQIRRALTAMLAGAVSISAANAAQVITLGGGPSAYKAGKGGFVNGNTFDAAMFNQPYGVAVQPDGTLIVADRKNNALRDVTDPGDDAASITGTFGPKIRQPVAVAVDRGGRVYAASQKENSVYILDANGSVVSTITISAPVALAVDSSTNLYIADASGSISYVAPGGSPVGLAGGFSRPAGMVLVNDSTLAVTDAGTHGVYAVDVNSGVVTTIAGGNGAGYLDGPAATAQFNAPHGIARSANGTLVIADRMNHRVRMIGTNGTVGTVYGVSKTSWVRPFPGWREGTEVTAHAREPIGIAVGPGDQIYVTELYWNLVRQVNGAPFTVPPVQPPGTNDTNTVYGTNLISLGFVSGEGSSEFIGAAGQTFYAPVTLSLAQNQDLYSFQFGMVATNEGATALSPATFGFSSMLAEQKGDATNGFYLVDIAPSHIFLNTAIQQLSVGWLEREGETNLYDTKAQDLVTYSIAHNHLYSKPKPIVGAFTFPIPSSAAADETYLVSLLRPSGTADGVEEDVPITVARGEAGGLQGMRRLTLGSRLYVVGDAEPFRWFNAGDFGEGYLLNNDIMQVFQSAVYGWNRPPSNSDFFNTLDSSDGSAGGAVYSGDDTAINSVVNGDGSLNADDVFVTFRRSLDPSLKWFARYWSNGVRQVVEVPNVARPGGTPAAASAAAALPKSLERPSAVISTPDLILNPGQSVQIPVRANIIGACPIRVMMLSISVQALDGSPGVSGVSFTPSAQFGLPTMTESSGPNNVAAVWLNEKIAGVTGNAMLGFLNVTLPVNAQSHSAYRVNFDHFSASPNGLGLFSITATPGVITCTDRSGSTWGDGISDIWRFRFFGSLLDNNSADFQDPDSDGAPNAVEYNNGTNPLSAN